MDYYLRLATFEDKLVIKKLIEDSARALSQQDYSLEQIEIAIKYIYGVDSDLITDQTYFVAIDSQTQQIIGSGGWSKRKTLFGGDQYTNRQTEFLDPSRDAAKIRAFFIHPNHARKGIAKAILLKCEEEAKLNGFNTLELLSTLPGLKLYSTLGFQPTGKVAYEFEGITVDFVPMTKQLN
ncbi:MAG: GNAT family N-acetyltransferase [Acidobacteria bacterium]|nr:GNAT family N-acetyltransferase [Acidobacteriota bacterium]